MMKHPKPLIALLTVGLLSLATGSVTGQSAAIEPVAVDVQRTLGGVVASDSPPASRVGRDILAQGGNAVDAAVATALAMAVTWPEAGNIGGGGFMMIAPPQGDVVCIDYREKAPLSTNKNSFLKQTNRCDSRMVGVPGTVRGLAMAQQEFGKLSWPEVVRPAVKLAREGFIVHPELARSVNGAVRWAKARPAESYGELVRVYGRADGRDWRGGDIMKLPDLAATLERIEQQGPDEFYTGKTANLLAEFMASSDGFITRKDLQEYRAVRRRAVKIHFRDFQVFGPPPPSSGGITVGLMLAMLDEIGLAKPPENVEWNADHVHLIAETMRRGFRERAAHLGDSDFVEIPAHLSDPEFARQLAENVDRQRATASEDIAGEIPLNEGAYESQQTTHFSVVDEDGMAVSNTYTLEASWGARVIAPGTGVVLNNEMGDFNWFPGLTNEKGTIGTQANQIEPGKRMLSSMTPTIVKRDGQVVLVVGSPGGRTIINTVFGILVQRLIFEKSLPQAVAARRFHHQWFPDQIRMEDRWKENMDLVEELNNRGHQTSFRGRQGSAHGIAIDPETGVRTGVSDWRRGGRVAVTR